MPELPEVETVCRGLRPAMVGLRLSRVDQRRADLRFPFPAAFQDRLEGRRITAIDRRAKYILIRLDDGWGDSRLGQAALPQMVRPPADKRAIIPVGPWGKNTIT
jgi:formamidopyrimidine-DNA glycosylase